MFKEHNLNPTLNFPSYWAASEDAQSLSAARGPCGGWTPPSAPWTPAGASSFLCRGVDTPVELAGSPAPTDGVPFEINIYVVIVVLVQYT